MCVCVCVCEREREREIDGEKKFSADCQGRKLGLNTLCVHAIYHFLVNKKFMFFFEKKFVISNECKVVKLKNVFLSFVKSGERFECSDVKKSDFRLCDLRSSLRLKFAARVVW